MYSTYHLRRMMICTYNYMMNTTIMCISTVTRGRRPLYTGFNLLDLFPIHATLTRLWIFSFRLIKIPITEYVIKVKETHYTIESRPKLLEFTTHGSLKLVSH